MIAGNVILNAVKDLGAFNEILHCVQDDGAFLGMHSYVYPFR